MISLECKETRAVPNERLAYTAAETCAALGISATTLWRLERLGLLTPVRHLRHRLYARSEIERFLSRSGVEAEKQGGSQ
jgi:hypothetical protein